MNDPARLDLAGDRWVAFIRKLPILNADLTGATFAMQVRSVPDAPGSPLITLATVATAAEEGLRLIEVESTTVADHIVAGRLRGVPSGYDETSLVVVSLIGIRINETSMEALPFPDERGNEAVLAWDIHVTPLGGIKQKYAGGPFTVRAGATQ